MTQDMANRIVFILCFFLLSCGGIRKAERRVLSNPESAERVFRELEKTRPCSNDTSYITSIDTIVEVDHYVSRLPALNFPSFAIPNNVEKHECKKEKIIVSKTGYVVDNRRLNVALDSVRYFKTLNDINSKDKNKYQKRFILLIIGIIIYAIIKIKL